MLIRFSRLLTIIGNIVYHFDRALFGLLAPFLAPLFFPKIDPLYALICIYAITPLSILTRPLGALVFGYLGDRIGRKKVLSITLLGMSVKTALMGFLPTYQHIGILAPICLAFTRLAVSFFSAGETTGGAIFLLENTKQEKRNFLSSLFDASGVLGTLLASCSIALLSSYENFWRILFWIGGGIGIIGWIFRKLPDEKSFQATKEKINFKFLWKYREAIFAIAAVAGFSYANYYLLSRVLNGLLPLISLITKEEMLSLNSLMLGLDFFLLPLFGWISLKVSKETLILFAILGCMLFAAPLFLLLSKATLWKAALVKIVLMVLGVCLAAPYHAWAFERAPPQHRYLVGAFGTAIGSHLFGSPLPILSLWLYEQTRWIIAPALPLILIGIFPLFSLFKSSRKLAGNSSTC